MPRTCWDEMMRWNFSLSYFKTIHRMLNAIILNRKNVNIWCIQLISTGRWHISFICKWSNKMTKQADLLFLFIFATTKNAMRFFSVVSIQTSIWTQKEGERKREENGIIMKCIDRKKNMQIFINFKLGYKFRLEKLLLLIVQQEWYKQFNQ